MVAYWRSHRKRLALPHPVVHFEIGCKDKETTATFYQQVFGWTIDAGPMGMINTGATSGIQGHIASLGYEPHQFTHFYIETNDVAASLQQVKPPEERQSCRR